MKLRWVILTLTVLVVYCSAVYHYGAEINRRFLETLEPNLIYCVMGPNVLILLGFILISVAFMDVLLKYLAERRGEKT